MFASLTSRIVALGAVVITAIAALVCLLLDASTQTRESFHWVTHSAEVIENVDEALGELRAAESGQRGYVLTRNPLFAQHVGDHLERSSRDMTRVLALTVDNPLQNGRVRTLRELMDARVGVLRRALDFARRGAFEQARLTVANGPGRDLMMSLSVRAQAFLDEEHALAVQRSAAADARLAQLQRRALFGGGAIALFVVLMCALIVRGVRLPIGVIEQAMTALGAGDRGARIADRMGSREFATLAAGYNVMASQLETAIADQGRSEHDLQCANRELVSRSEALRDRGRVIELLGGMAHRMQAARTDEELAQVIRVFLPRVLPGIRGALYAHNNSRNLLVPIGTWGGMVADAAGFAPDQCWALRRGQSHFVAAPDDDIVCGHVCSERQLYHCEPLLAGGEVIGTLYLEGMIDADTRFRLTVLAENIASALFNHRLQRGLREQTIRDPLTGLFNRRYMEEALAIEIARSRRSAAPLSLVMADVDHFKRFNDEFGHDAGDAVLQAVAAELCTRFRDGDVVCRFGGEEFTVIAPGTTAEALAIRVEIVRQAITEISMRHGGRTLGATSMSFGIATWDEAMDRSGQALVKAADAALYAAKRAGRNQAVIEHRQAA